MVKKKYEEVSLDVLKKNEEDAIYQYECQCSNTRCKKFANSCEVEGEGGVECQGGETCEAVGGDEGGKGHV